MVNYKNGKIYCIRSYQTDCIYIGSTTQSLSQRLSKHRQNYKVYNESKKTGFMSSFKLLKYDDCYIELIENCPCESREELERQEGKIIRNTEEKCINKIVPGRTRNEWRNDNIERERQKVREYITRNKKIINEKAKIRDRKYRSVKVQCDCGSIVTSRGVLNHKKTLKHKNWEKK